VFHDGLNTAYIQTTVLDWKPGKQIPIFSSTNALNGAFEVDQISDFLYTFQIPYSQVEGRLETSLVPVTIRTGHGDDLIRVASDVPGPLSVFDAAGGFDVIELFGTLASHTHVTQSQIRNGALTIDHFGLNRIVLRNAQRVMTVSGQNIGDGISLGDIGLGIVAQSLTLPATVSTASLELDLRDSFVLSTALQTLDLNLRVFGDNSGITVSSPLNVPDSIQLVAPDGTVSLPSGTQFTSAMAVVKARQLAVPQNRLTTSVDSLTVVLSSIANANLQVVNDRALLLTRQTPAVHLVQLDSNLGAIFANISWIANISAAWAEQIFDGALNPYAVILGGAFSLNLPAGSGNDEQSLIVDGGVKSISAGLTFKADEIDFRGGGWQHSGKRSTAAAKCCRYFQLSAWHFRRDQCRRSPQRFCWPRCS
jgi:hypothetical protein